MAFLSFSQPFLRVGDKKACSMYSHSQIFMVIGTVYLHIIDKEIILFILSIFLLKCDALSFSIFTEIEVGKEVLMHKMAELANGLYPRFMVHDTESPRYFYGPLPPCT